MKRLIYVAFCPFRAVAPAAPAVPAAPAALSEQQAAASAPQNDASIQRGRVRLALQNIIANDALLDAIISEFKAAGLNL